MSERKKYDIAVIGAGPGGYSAAIRAAQMGKTVALIEKKDFGGCCLNVGCIPTKALLSGTAVLHKIRQAKQFGISVGSVSVDYAQMKSRKDTLVAKIRSSLEGLLKTNKISLYRAEAKFESAYELKLVGQDNLFIEAGQIILATGSTPLDIPAFPCDHRRILNSTSMLELEHLPKSLVIIGGGYIGCEFATLFAELGVQVTIVEAQASILTAQGAQISQFMHKALKSRGISILTGTTVKKIDADKEKISAHLSSGETLDADLALVAVGRKVSTDGLRLEKAGLSPNEKGILETNSRMETKVPGIYAIGDLTGKWMLAHVAQHQGIVAASNAAGREMHIDYGAVPAVIFTSPEVATVGMTREQALDAKFEPAVGSFPFQALGKAVASLDTEGFAQIVADRKTGRILGAQVVGYDASNLIAEMALAIQNELTLESIGETIHAHPTMAESWLEAALIASGSPLNFPPRQGKSA